MEQVSHDAKLLESFENWLKSKDFEFVREDLLRVLRLARHGLGLEQLKLGCGAHLCRTKKPTGMANNGPCRCCDRIRDA